MAVTHNVDPEVGKARSKVSNAVKSGLPDDEVDRLRRELYEANILAKAKAVAAQLPELSPEKRARVAALLGGAQ